MICALLPRAQAMLVWPDYAELHDWLEVLQIPEMLTLSSLEFSFSFLLFTKLFICFKHKIQREQVKNIFKEDSLGFPKR